MRSNLILLVASFSTLGAIGCSNSQQAAPSPPCDQECMDGVAIHALRDTVKLVYNLTLQSKEAGAQDQTTPCPEGGQARVFGNATSNAAQGATLVQLTYTLDGCGYLRRDSDPKRTYDMTFTGMLTQSGTIAVEPSATTALIMASDSMSFSGTVYAPPHAYQEPSCALKLTQNGNNLSGTICDRPVGISL